MLSQNEIALRPRFKFGINKNSETVLSAFEEAKKDKSPFVISRIDNHVFIRLANERGNFWSPQLHVEINAIEEKSSIVSGLVGPNPTAWTLFMFLHFLVAGLFFAFGIWSYTNIVLSNPFSLQISLTILTVIIWCLLYLVGRIGRTSCNDEIDTLFNFMHSVINNSKNKLQTETHLKLVRKLN